MGMYTFRALSGKEKALWKAGHSLLIKDSQQGYTVTSHR